MNEFSGQIPALYRDPLFTYKTGLEVRNANNRGLAQFLIPSQLLPPSSTGCDTVDFGLESTAR